MVMTGVHLHAARGLAGLLVALLAPLAALASAVARAAPPAGPVPGGVLVIGTNAGPPGLDPHKSASGHTLMVAEHVYSSLLRLMPDGSIVGDLAEEYQVLDPTTYVFRLRRGVQWHHGRELTSQDVRYSLERLRDPQTASPWRGIWEIVDRVQTPDAYTVRIVTRRPFAPLVAYLASPWYSAIVPRELVEREGDLQRVMSGTGPFRLARYVPDNVVELVRNPDYYEPGLPYLDRLEYRVIPSEASRLAALRTGAIQYTWVEDPLIEPQLRQLRGVSVAYPDRPSATLAVWFNQTRPPFDHPDVRRAVSVGIDRRAIIAAVLRGRGAIATKIPPSSPYGYRGDGEDLPYYRHDVTLARQLLARAGYPDGLRTVLEVPSVFPVAVRTAEVMKEQLARVGIDVEIRQLEYGTALSRCLQTQQEGMCIIRHVWQPDPDAYLYPIYHSGSSVNLGKWADPVVDELLQQGRTTLDFQSRRAIYQRLERHVAEMAYVVVPYAFDYAELVPDRLQGYASLPGGAPPGTRSRQLLKGAWLDR